MKFFFLMLVCSTSFAAKPVGYVVRTNIENIYHAQVQLGQVITLPASTKQKDHWFTVRYYATCQEETHINSRENEAVDVKINKVLEGQCEFDGLSVTK